MSEVRNFSAGQILAVAEEHVRTYQARIQWATEGRKGFNLELCQHYLDLWSSVIEKDGQDLSEDEESEILDAYESGKYEEILGPAE